MSRGNYTKLFAPLTLRGVTLRCRVLAGPAPVPLSRDGCPDAAAIDAYEARARGGAAAVTVSEGDVDWDGPETPYFRQSVRALTEAIGRHGAAASLRLSAGAGAAARAERAQALGFGMVELTGAAEALTEGCRQIREACGDDLVVACVLPPADGCACAEAVKDWADLLITDDLVLSESVKKLVPLPVAVGGGFLDPGQVDAVLAAGRCDLAVMGQQQLADPDFVVKALLGREAEIAPCVDCGGCDGPGLPRCAADPRCGRELSWRTAPRPTGKRRVMVVGGGAAGLYAAATAAERGHDVILTEACRQLGGLLWYTDIDGRREALRRFRDCLIARCRRLGVKLQLGTAATADYLRQMAPDAVICAVGAQPVRLTVPGAERARHALSAYENADRVGRRVVVISAGGAGHEIAGWLAPSGREVLVLELDGAQPPSGALFAHEGGVTLTELADDGVRYLDRSGAQRLSPADTVLYSVGQWVDEQAVDELRAASGLFFPVGGCAGAAGLGEAVFQGFCAAMDIL